MKNKKLFHLFKAILWFSIGGLLSAFLLISFAFIFYQKTNSTTVYSGISVGNISLEQQTKKNIEAWFEKRNETIWDTQFTFVLDSMSATVSARQLQYGYDSSLLAQQAYSLGRSDNFFSNVSIIAQAYFTGINLEPAYHFSEETLFTALNPIILAVDKNPVDALFRFQNGRVQVFRPSENGQRLDVDKLKKDLSFYFEPLLLRQKSKNITIPLALKIIEPKITTDKANNLGIKELIGVGTSLFQHSIPGRAFNISLASSRINGVLIAPNEEFSFNKALGDVSSFTGYKQAYVIQNGKTVLGDGGGVCQVSTTFFRALLNAGLPVTERNAHAYRVGYYEQDGPPGLDATIYVPSVDLKFKNDTGNYILAQTFVDNQLQKLTINLYGTADGRVVSMTKPTITNRIAPPPDLYQDDPSLPKGAIKQVDFSAEGSRVSFKREVFKESKKVISETFVSNYAPWQNVFLRGTKE